MPNNIRYKRLFYVENLILGEGSTLDLNGLNLYCLSYTHSGAALGSKNGMRIWADNNGDWHIESIAIPEPTLLSLLAIGGLSLLRRRRRA